MVLDSSVSSRAVERTRSLTAHDLQAEYLGEVLRYVSSFVRPVAEAEDVVMEVFQAAFLGLHRLKRNDDPRVWLLGIARRKVANSLRLRYRRSEVPFPAKEQVAPLEPGAAERKLMVQQLLAQLPIDQREVLVLKYVNGLSTLEIASVLGRSEAATNSILQRARASFQAKGASLFQDPEVDHV